MDAHQRNPRNGKTFDEVYLRLCRGALDLDETADELERLYLSDGQGWLLSLPQAHYDLGLSRLDQCIHEAIEVIDDRPRLHRLRDLAA